MLGMFTNQVSGTWTDYNTTLSPYNGSILAAYKFNNGGFLVDSINSYTLTNNGTVINSSSGKRNYCAQLSGSNYFTMTWPSETQPSLFLSTWINTTSIASRETILSVLASSNDYVADLDIASGNLNFRMSNTSGADYSIAGSTTITINNWHHIAAYFDGTYNRVYLDGSLDGTSSAFTGSLRTATQWAIGRRQAPGDLYFSGLIDELYYWRGASALFADDGTALNIVQALYNNGKGSFLR